MIEKIKDYIKIRRLTSAKVIVLVVVYLIMRDGTADIPYLNIITKDLAGKATILATILLLMFRPSANKLIVGSIGLLVLHFLSMVFIERNEAQSIGLIIYLFLIFLIYRMVDRLVKF